MKNHLPIVILTCLIGGNAAAAEADPAFWSWAVTLPMGWNSWDSYC
jgi:uncharacterized membrane protein YbjE (DUF340 family)